MSSPEITELLAGLRDGRPRALDQLLPLIYSELRVLARRRLAGQIPGQTLTATALVHEAYLKLFDRTQLGWNDRQHFFAVAAMAMRQIIVDHARRQRAGKRGGEWERIELDSRIAAPDDSVVDVIALDAALERLAALEPRLARMVELRYFAGLSVEETAEGLGVTDRTVKRDWRKARALLLQFMEGSP